MYPSDRAQKRDQRPSADASHARRRVAWPSKGVSGLQGPSPLLSNRMAQAHLQIGHLEQARSGLEQSLEDYPDFTDIVSLILLGSGALAALFGLTRPDSERSRAPRSRQNVP